MVGVEGSGNGDVDMVNQSMFGEESKSEADVEMKDTSERENLSKSAGGYSPSKSQAIKSVEEGGLIADTFFG